LFGLVAQKEQKEVTASVLTLFLDQPTRERRMNDWTNNHSNKNRNNNCSGDKQSNSQALIPLERLFHTKKPVTNNAMVRPLIITPSAIWAISSIGDLGHRFDLRFLRRLSIRKSSSFLPPLIAATSQRGLTPRPAQVSPDGPRYFGGTFLPFN